MKIFLNKNINSKNIILTGNHSSGKSLLACYLKCFKSIEILIKDPNITIISSLNYLKKLNLENSVHLLNNLINNIVFSISKGRNINFRINDETSLFNYGYPKKYLNRILSKNFVIQKKNYFIFDVHNALLNYNLFKKTLQNPYFLHFERHPVDLIMSNYKKKLFLFKDATYRQILTIKKKNKYLPFYCSDINPTNKLINLTIDIVYKIFRETYYQIDKISLREKKQILILKHQDFKTNPIESIFKIKKMLNIETNSYLNSIIKSEILPLGLILAKRKKNYKKILKLASKSHIKKMNEISYFYEKNL